MSFQWTDEIKEQVVEEYQENNPTPETSSEIVADIAKAIGATPNGVRMILIKAGVYVSKDPNKKKESGGKRVSKVEALESLAAAISAKGLEPDMDIIGKLTGKAAVYFASILDN